MNYDEANDQYLDDRLAELVGFKPTEIDKLACAMIRSLKTDGICDDSEKDTPSPDYCKDWGATMPLAIEHGVSLIERSSASYEKRKCKLIRTGDYCAEIPNLDSDGFHIGWIPAVDKNPLRAIVICLIKKLESEK